MMIQGMARAVAGAWRAEQKSVGIAYAFWAGGGLLGLHRVYLGQVGSAAGMCLITLLSLVLVPTGLGLLGFVAVGTWTLADAVLIPDMARGQSGPLVAGPQTT